MGIKERIFGGGDKIVIQWDDKEIKSQCSKGVDRAKLLSTLQEIIDIETEDDIKKNQPTGS